ncbi:MAG: bifunctional ADP-dependent NAD(P)H-hydrate dehydratase/NAD(P)H-hydrate epimerase, partial [Candidatus Hydrogenedentes bacterium]|nr:bifunctional ADP-dependent NAD(P)H-hydrate dehydratase/NAD(P)H-hydrate epimerase [Candidatus Hydrogenedentota bacterium]
MSQKLSRKRVREILPERPVDGHKGTFGHLFVIAGSRGFTGAAKLTCRAAGRSGVGLVTLGVPHTLSDVVGASLLETMSIGLAATDRATLA